MVSSPLALARCGHTNVLYYAASSGLYFSWFTFIPRLMYHVGVSHCTPPRLYHPPVVLLLLPLPTSASCASYIVIPSTPLPSLHCSPSPVPHTSPDGADWSPEASVSVVPPPSILPLIPILTVPSICVPQAVPYLLLPPLSPPGTFSCGLTISPPTPLA